MDDKMKSLSQQKDAIEKEVAFLQKQISEMEEIEGYNKGLVDIEGFPRPELDFGKLQQYRSLKKRLNELGTDHSNLMAEIENELFALHKKFAESGQAQRDIEEYEANLEKRKQEQEQKQREIDQMNELLKEKAAQKAAVKAMPIPFCQITVVIENSPAYQGGLRENDLVTAFGVINSSNFQEINQVVEVVRNNINLEIPVQILRVVDQDITDDTHTYMGKTYTPIKTVLVPRKWEGEGVLGCRFALIL